MGDGMAEEQTRLRSMFDEVALRYDAVRPGYPEALFDDVPEPVREEIECTGLFSTVAVRRYPWDLQYDAASYLRVLDLFGPSHTGQP
jgi:hypothetical protein